MLVWFPHSSASTSSLSVQGAAGALRGRAAGGEEEIVVRSNMGKPHRRWTGPEKWSVGLAAVGVLVAIIATVGQFAH